MAKRNNEYQRTVGYNLGWTAKTSIGSQILWGVVALVASIASFILICTLPMSLAYSLTAIPVVDVHECYDEQMDEIGNTMVYLLESMFGWLGHILFVLLTLIRILHWWGWLLVGIAVTVPFYLLIKYFDNDSHRPTFTSY